MTAEKILSIAGYSEDQIAQGAVYAAQFGCADEDERGAYMLARILYSDSQLRDTPVAPWEPCCYADDSSDA